MKNWNILRNPIANDAAILTISQYIAAGLSFFTTAVAARILGPKDYGMAALLISYPMLVWSFVGIKSLSVTTRYISSFRATERNEEIKSICKLGYGLDFLISMVAFILVAGTGWWVVPHMLHLPQMTWLMIIYTASFLFLSLNDTSWAVLSSWRMWHWLGIFQILDKAIVFLIVLGLLWSGFGMKGLVLGTTIGNIIFGLSIAILATYLLWRDGVGLWWKASFSRVMSIRKELTAFFSWNYLTVSLNGLAGQIPLIMLGYLRGPEEAGFYRLALGVTMASAYLETSLGKVSYPILSADWAVGKAESFTKTLKRWTLRIGLPISAFLLSMIPLIPSVVPKVFGSGYAPMVAGLQIMMLGAVVNALFFWLIQFYQASARFALWTKGYGLYTIMVIGLGWFCIQRWGFLGLAILITMAKIAFTLSMALGLKESPLRR